MNASRSTLLLLLATACGTTTSIGVPVCTPSVTAPTEAAAPGDAVTLEARPMSADFDTRVRVDGLDATIAEVTRDGCTTCDQCRADAGCTDCETCEACEDLCTTCVESVTFTVPAADPGLQPVLLINRYGTSAVVDLEVTAPVEDTDDTDAADTDDTDATDTDDTAATDTDDTGAADTDATDTDTSDTAADDTDTSDTAAVDTDAVIDTSDTAAPDTDQGP